MKRFGPGGEGRRYSRPDGQATAADDARLRRALLIALQHPLRSRILAILAERRAGVRELARKIGAPEGRIGDQVRRLRRQGLMTVEETRPVRGDEDFAALPPESQASISLQAIRSACVDAAAAIRAGNYHSRSQNCTAHTRMSLDECGWHELAEIHRRALEEMLALRCAVAERVARDRSPTRPAVSKFAPPGRRSPSRRDPDRPEPRSDTAALTFLSTAFASSRLARAGMSGHGPPPDLGGDDGLVPR